MRVENRLAPGVIGECQARGRLSSGHQGEDYFLGFGCESQFRPWPDDHVGVTRMRRTARATRYQKEAACATLSEVGRKYPKASASVKRGVEQEIKRAKC